MLIRKAVDNDYHIELQNLQVIDWNNVINHSMAYGIGAIAFDGMQSLPSEYRPSQEMLLEWIGEVLIQSNQYKQQWEVANKLAEWWSEEGISATVIKGRSIAQYYPKPEHRYSCDLDVFIEDGWDEACRVLEKKGIELEHEVYKEVEFTLDGVYVECHRYITPVRGNETLLRFEKYLRSLLNPDRGQVPVRFEGSKLLKPSLMFTSMLFIEHALGDFLHGKLTLKHVVDWIVLRKQQLNWNTFNFRCEKFHFERFLALLNAVADVVEGKREYYDLSADYKEAFDELFDPDRGQVPVRNTANQTWFQRRVALFFDIVNNRSKFSKYGYCSMEKFLFNAIWAHFFKKEVKL